MSASASVTTGKGTGAIAVIQLVGDSAETIIKKVFRPTGKAFKPGEILLGTISDGSEIIDQVIIACEGPDHFAVNCHGNPLVVADIMQLLKQQGAELLIAEQLLTKVFSAEKLSNTIALEAKLTQLQAKTIQGTKIIANQVDAGLTKKIKQWLQNTTPFEKIKTDAEKILKDSQMAKLLIFGCTAVLSGPPNTGKSTLLNFLAGRQKSIVTDIKGTTRDWVSAKCRIGPMLAEFIDTAGLTETPDGTVEKASQQKSFEMLEKTNVVLLILDNSQTDNHLDEYLLKKITDKKIITVLNKSDLPAKFNTAKLPENLTDIVQISAKLGSGIETLLEKIQIVCGVTNFDLHAPVCFAPRQENLLEQLKNADSKDHAAKIITELLNAPLSV